MVKINIFKRIISPEHARDGSLQPNTLVIHSQEVGNASSKLLLTWGCTDMGALLAEG